MSTVEQPDLDLRRQRIEHRLRMAKAQQSKYEPQYPTQRPNGETPLQSRWFEDEHGVRCRLLSDNPLTIAAYSAMMEAKRR